MPIKYEMIEIQNGQIAVAQEIQDQIKMLTMAKEQLDELTSRLKLEMYIAMQENGIKKFESDTLKITRVDPSKRKSVDVQKLKDAGLYEEYSYESETSGYVKVEVK